MAVSILKQPHGKIKGPLAVSIVCAATALLSAVVSVVVAAELEQKEPPEHYVCFGLQIVGALFICASLVMDGIAISSGSEGDGQTMNLL